MTEELWIKVDEGQIDFLNIMDGDLDSMEVLEGEYGDFQAVSIVDPYTGPTTFTPTKEEQTIAAMGKTFDSNVTIQPIPNNYGLITWDGSVITVS